MGFRFIGGRGWRMPMTTPVQTRSGAPLTVQQAGLGLSQATLLHRRRAAMLLLSSNPQSGGCPLTGTAQNDANA
jgi:hypothetical protein